MRTLTAKWAGTCAGCGEAFPAGEKIAWRGTGDTWHVACHEADLETLRAADKADAERWAEATRASERWDNLRTVATDTELLVYGAPGGRKESYRVARAEAHAFVCSVAAAGGRVGLVKHRRGGKTFLGRELTSGGNAWGGIVYHDGWSFPYRVLDPGDCLVRDARTAPSSASTTPSESVSA